MGTISKVQSGTFPSLTPGSFVSYGCGPNPGWLVFQVEGTGTFSLSVANSISGNNWSTLPDSSIKSNTGATGPVTSAGTYRVPVPGGGSNGQLPSLALGAIIYATASDGSNLIITPLFLADGNAPFGDSSDAGSVTIAGPSNLLTPTDGLNETFTVVANNPTNLPSHALTGQYAILRAPSTNAAPVMWGYGNTIGASIAANNHASFILPGAAASVLLTNTNKVWYNSINSSDLLVVEAA